MTAPKDPRHGDAPAPGHETKDVAPAARGRGTRLLARPVAVAGLSAALGLALGALWLRPAGADGVPVTPTLNYAGTIVENGAPASGSRMLALSLWSAETGGTKHCERPSAEVTLQAGGRFRVPFDQCLATVRANANTWVQIDLGSQSFPRKKLGAVPYAIEAERASLAGGVLATQVVPSGAVMAFDLAACPPGWTELADAQGRVIVGAGAAAVGAAPRVRGDKGGADSVTLTVAQLPAHSHPITDPGHMHPGRWGAYISAGSPGDVGPASIAQSGASYVQASTTGASATGIAVGNTGSGAALPTMPPFYTLLYCKKS